MLTVAVANFGNCPEVTPIGYVTEMAPAFVVKPVPHPDRKTADHNTRKDNINNRHVDDMTSARWLLLCTRFRLTAITQPDEN
jgi:hypothetical protein